ncbi:MAG TPA: hypothetical protein VHB30_03425, partial [Solirubrobacteraceae bacterium]|nr:hypothetical protein [Solirubrobacteraceae bacterium]
YLGIAHLQHLPLPLADPPSAKPDKLLEYWFPAILVLGCGAWLAVCLRDRRPARDWAAAPLLAVGLGLLLSRPDEFHLVPLSVALAVAVAMRPTPALLVVLALIALHGVDRRLGQALHPPGHAAVPGGAGDGVWTSPQDAAALRGLIPYVRRLAPPGEPVFVAVPRWDRVRVGDPELNVLLDRANPTRYDVVQPGLVTKASVQREMVRDLAGTRVVVVWHGAAATAVEDNGSARSSGVHVLDRYLAREFRPDRRFGDYRVLVRR